LRASLDRTIALQLEAHTSCHTILTDDRDLKV
jgi:hypothetical protein